MRAWTIAAGASGKTLHCLDDDAYTVRISDDDGLWKLTIRPAGTFAADANYQLWARTLDAAKAIAEILRESLDAGARK